MLKPAIYDLNAAACVATAATAIAILGASVGETVIATGAACNLPVLATIGTVSLVV